MSDLAIRLLVAVNMVVPLLVFMACVYLALHIIFARVIRDPGSPVLWFFSVVTGPLTRPVRRLLPAGLPEPRVRSLSLLAYVGLWLVVKVALALLLPPRIG